MKRFTSLTAGDLIVGGPWNDGALPVPQATLHRFDGFDNMGLAIALCGMRQEHRSNGWAAIGPNEYQERMIGEGKWPECVGCKEASWPGK